MGFEFTGEKYLVRNDVSVAFEQIDGKWRTSIERIECRPIQNIHLSPAPVSSAKEAFIQKVAALCDGTINVPTDMQQNKS
jgi:hypothetical protein